MCCDSARNASLTVTISYCYYSFSCLLYLNIALLALGERPCDLCIFLLVAELIDADCAVELTASVAAACIVAADFTAAANLSSGQWLA